MYQYTEFDKQFVRHRAAQFRDQLERCMAGKLSDDEFRPLRLQNGWYIQRYAPMLRIAVPYGEISSAQLRVLAAHRPRIRPARAPSCCTTRRPNRTRWAQCRCPAAARVRSHLKYGYGHFTTRTERAVQLDPAGQERPT